jgi:hypothetical protein
MNSFYGLLALEVLTPSRFLVREANYMRCFMDYEISSELYTRFGRE